MAVAMGENTDAKDATRMTIFFCVVVRTLYSSPEATRVTGVSDGGSGLGSCAACCSSITSLPLWFDRTFSIGIAVLKTLWPPFASRAESSIPLSVSGSRLVSS